MSQPAMERALGKLVMDVGFRDAFARDPIEANRAAGIDLTRVRLRFLWNSGIEPSRHQESIGLSDTP